MKSQRGSVTALALLTMIFLGIIISGLLPMVTNEMKMGTMNKDIIEAQYAAEAGAKRAINEFNKVKFSQTPNWSWLNSNTAFINDVNTKKYKVIIYLSTDASQTHVTPSFTTSNTYIIKSTGTVNSATKTVFLSILVTGGGGGNPPTVPGLASDAAVYAGQSLDVKNGATFNGASIVSGGDIETKNNLHIATPYGLYKNKSLAIPQYSAEAYKGFPSLGTSSTNLNGGTYYVEGKWVIDNNATISGNGIIFVNGDIKFPQNVNFNGTVLIIATGDMDASNSNNVNFPSGVLISYKNIDAKNSFNLTGAVIAAGSVSFKNNVNITYSSSVLNSFSIPTTNGSGTASTSLKTGSWKIQ